LRTDHAPGWRWEWCLALLAPVVVIVGLVVLRRAPLVFLFYHVGLCLVVPWLVSRREGLGWRAHAAALGLAPRGVLVGLGSGLLLAAVPPVLFALVPAFFPDAERLGSILVRWGLEGRDVGATLLFLALINGPAEELFWRGWLPTRLGDGAGAAVVLSLLFTSYHVVTIAALAPGAVAAAAMLAGVAAAAGCWAAMRRRWGSVWPALLSHTGAAVGYALVARGILG
jgi:membrane protease YdiL (CAAX protease family)